MGSTTPATQLFGHYAPRRKLGEGAMGEVWLARDKVLNRDVALKVLRADTAGGGGATEGAIRNFLREARAAARLNHPNAVTVHEMGRQNGRVFVAMELAEGGSVADEVRDKGALPWPEATQAVRDAAAGLAAAHQAGLVHRDVKPSNLMRCARGVVKVADFGLAKDHAAADPQQTQTRPGVVMGSPAYMSPEQCRGEPADARSDLYSLACSYYHLLTRQPPFPGSDVTEVLYHQCHKPPPDPRATAAGLPDGVCRVLKKGMQKDPARRYQTAAELIADLDAVLHTPEASHTFDGEVVPAKLAKPAAGRGGAGPRFAHTSVRLLKGKGMMGKLTWAAVAAALTVLLTVSLRRQGAAPATPPPPTDPALALAASDKGGQPPPGVGAAEAKIRELFRAEYADHTPAGKLRLAKTLLAQGGEKGVDPATRYACFRDARDLAAQAGDTDLAFAAIDQTARAFDGGTLEPKITALVTAHQMIPAEASAAAAEAGLGLLDEALASGDLRTAGRLVQPLKVLANRAKPVQLPLVSRVETKAREVKARQDAAAALAAADAAIKTNPGDPNANLVLGRHLCFVKGDWDKGLPMLAKGTDRGLKESRTAKLA